MTAAAAAQREGPFAELRRARLSIAPWSHASSRTYELAPTRTYPVEPPPADPAKRRTARPLSNASSAPPRLDGRGLVDPNC